MTLPSVTQTVLDGGLGIQPDSIESAQAKVGMASLGTPNTFYSFSSLQQIRDTLGTGPLPEALAHALEIAGPPVYGMSIAGSVTGTVGGVTKSNSLSPTVAVAGSPADAYDVVITITREGVPGDAAFTYTLDGGDVTSAEIAMPAPGLYVLGDTGLTLSFASGTYNVDDTYSFATTAPGYSSSDLATTIDALLDDPTDWAWCHVVGAASTVSGAATIASVLDTKATAAFAAFRYVFFVMEAPADDTDANLAAAFTAVESTRVYVCAGAPPLTSSLTGRVDPRSAAVPFTARLGKIPMHEHPGWVAAGGLPGVGPLDRDESKTQYLDAQRFTTLRTWPRKAGAYVVRGRSLAAAGSDFEEVQHRRVMDAASRIAYAALLPYVNASFRIDAVTGFIDERDARRVEKRVKAALDAGLVAAGHASATQFSVSRTENMLSTRTLRTTTKVLPFGYASFIVNELSFTNPALNLVVV